MKRNLVLWLFGCSRYRSRHAGKLRRGLIAARPLSGRDLAPGVSDPDEGHHAAGQSDRELEIQLGVAAVAEQVSVTAEAPVIDTATVSVGTLINQRTVQEIPLNGLHFVDRGLLTMVRQ